MNKQHTLSILLACAMLTASTAPADSYSENGRQVFKKFSTTAVTVQLVLKNKLSMSGRQGQSSESRQEITGTIVSPDGLTVVSLSTIDPGHMVESMMGNDRIRMESELADVKLLLQDGTELPSEVVLRDKDLDLAFLRPKDKPSSPLPYVDLTQSGKADVLDEIVALNRLGNAAGRSYSAAAERISAVVQRPRLFYVPDANMTTSSLGCPAFTLDGKVLGIMLVRTTRTGTSASSLNSQNPNVTGIILPAADVLRVMKEVPAAGQAREQSEEKEKKESAE